MADSPAIPLSEDAVGVAINALVAQRPTALSHVDIGRYSNVLVGWKAQNVLAIQRLADEVRSTRLPFATGKALRDLAASEYDTVPFDGPTPAVGFITASRGGAGFTQGTIKKGTRIRRSGNASANPPQKDVVYSLLSDVLIPAGVHGATFPVQAQTLGALGNTPPDDGTNTSPTANPLAFVDPVYDSTILSTGATVTAAGGSDGVTDADLRIMARAMAAGRFGPTVGSAVAGVLTLASMGVKRAAPFEDMVNGILYLGVADGSYNGNAYWAGKVRRSLLDSEFVGFGCQITCVPATRAYVNIAATVVLRDTQSQAFTTDITNAIGSSLTDYFTIRPDWYVFRNAAIRGLVGRADPRVLTCTSVTVSNALTGVTLADPTTPAPVTGGVLQSSIAGFNTGLSLTFWTMANNGLSLTYVNPS